MTTLRIEVARYSGTTVEDVVAGLRLAGCMKYLEIDPDEHAFLPVDELRAALVSTGFHVELIPWPPPPPLPFWRRVLNWPRRVYYWGRRVVLRETHATQLVKVLGDAYMKDGDLMGSLGMRDSPFLRKIQQDPTADSEPFTFHGQRAPIPADLAPLPFGKPPCPDCGQVFTHAEDCELALWQRKP